MSLIASLLQSFKEETDFFTNEETEVIKKRRMDSIEEEIKMLSLKLRAMNGDLEAKKELSDNFQESIKAVKEWYEKHPPHEPVTTPYNPEIKPIAEPIIKFEVND